MTRRSGLVAGLLAVGAIVALILLYRLGQRQGVALQGLERSIAELKSQTARLRSEASARTQARRAQPADDTTRQITAARRSIEARKSRPSDDPLRRRLLPGFVSIANAGDKGQGSPKDVVETSLWAIRQANVERLAACLVPGAGGTEAAKAMFDGLSPEQKAQFGSPDALLATLMIYSYDVAGYQIDDGSQVGTDPSQWRIRASVQLEDGRTVQPVLNLQMEAGTWRLVYGVKAVQQYAVFLKANAG